MTNIQIMLFCILTTLLVVSEVLLLIQYHLLKSKINKTTKLYEENINKMQGLCNKIYDKLKEVVDKVNPLLATANAESKNDDVQEAVFVEEN